VSVFNAKCFVLFFPPPVTRAASPSPQSVRRVSSSRSVSGSPEPTVKKPPAPPSPVQSQSPSTNWSPAVPIKKAKSPTPSPSPARVCICLALGILYKCVYSHFEVEKIAFINTMLSNNFPTSQLTNLILDRFLYYIKLAVR
jgi:hypothetical protein